VHDVRMRKDVDELRAIARSFASVLEGQAAVERNALPGVSEIELFSAAQAAGQNHAGRPTGFAADLLCGVRTAQVCCPVAVPGGQRLQENDVVVADVSVGNGYWGDSARTYVVGSRPEIDETYAGIAEVLVAAVAELKPGTVCADVFALMEREILERFPDGSFPHHGGHGLGITTFEDPHLIPADRTPLETGMILAVEPGVYFDGRYGVRLENLYLVTPDGGIDIMEVV